MIEKISNWIEDRLLNLSELLFWAFYIGSVVIFIGSAVFVLGDQLAGWLEYGYAEPRDGFWLLAMLDCGEIWCRQDFFFQTGWVGVDRIGNWVMDLHVMIYAFFVGWIASGIGAAWADSIGKWEVRKERLRRPKPPADD